MGYQQIPTKRPLRKAKQLDALLVAGFALCEPSRSRAGRRVSWCADRAVKIRDGLVATLASSTRRARIPRQELLGLVPDSMDEPAATVAGRVHRRRSHLVIGAKVDGLDIAAGPQVPQKCIRWPYLLASMDILGCGSQPNSAPCAAMAEAK